MIVETSYGPVWVSETAPHYHDFRGKLLFKQRFAGKRHGSPKDRAL